MTSCDVCKKDFSDRDEYIGGKLIAKFDLFYAKHWSNDTRDMCEECLCKVLNFIGKLKRTSE